jgi:hypothetical protein
LEQIEPDLYDDFMVRRFKKPLQQHQIPQKSQQVIKDYRPKNKPKAIDGRFRMNEQNFPALIGNKPEPKHNKENTQNLKSIFDKPQPAKTIPTPVANKPSQSKTSSSTSQPISDNQIRYDTPQNKLTRFFDNKIEPPKKEAKPDPINKKKLKKDKDGYDDDFPEL